MVSVQICSSACGGIMGIHIWELVHCK
jgi:hypothetical protein